MSYKEFNVIIATVCLKINYVIFLWFVVCFHMFPLILTA